MTKAKPILPRSNRRASAKRNYKHHKQKVNSTLASLLDRTKNVLDTEKPKVLLLDKPSLCSTRAVLSVAPKARIIIPQHSSKEYYVMQSRTKHIKNVSVI
jgi:hypothetical protein